MNYEMSRVQRIMETYGCDAADATLFLDFREEGYSVHVAALLAGIADPEGEQNDY